MSQIGFPYRTFAIAALSTIGASALATEYSLEAIIDPDGGTAWPSSISEDGTVVGQSWRGGAPPACFKYINGVYSLLPLPGDASECRGAAIDSKGNVTLTYRPKEGGKLRVVELTTRGKFRALQGPVGNDNYVNASNNGRMAGGTVSATRNDAYIFNRTDEGVNVGVLTGYPTSHLTGINSRGVAVGNVESQDRSNQAFVYQKGRISWLMPLNGGSRTYVEAINKLNMAVGASHLDPAGADPSQRATSWTSPDTAQNIGSAYGFGTYAYAINSSNHVVGTETAGLGLGILFKDGAATELGNLLKADQKSIWGPVGTATAINDQGLIAGRWVRRIADGKLVAYLLRPLP